MLPDAVIGDAYTSDHAWERLESIAMEPRPAGHPGERRAAERLAEAFRSIGLDSVGLTPFDIQGWHRGSSKLKVDTAVSRHFEAQHEVIALPGSSAGSVSAPLINVGAGRPAEFDAADVEGRIAIVTSDTPGDDGRWIHRMEKYAHAVREGASGFIFRNHVEGCLPPTGEIGYDRRPAPIPGVGVSKEVGAELSRLTEAGTVDAELTVDCETASASSHNVEGTLGPATDRELLVTAHVDSHDISVGARDNATGCALLCEVARLLRSIADELSTRVRFVAFGAEEIGLKGSSAWAATHDLEAISAVVNIDGAGYSETLHVNTNTFDDLATAFTAAGNDLGVSVEIEDTVTPHGDQWPFVQAGVPGAMTGSFTTGGRGWGHTHADTLDKLDRRHLRELAIAIATAVAHLALAERPPERKRPTAVRDALDEGYVTELTVADRWPFDDR